MTAAIEFAWEHRADSLLLLDEKRGRVIAIALGLQVRDILGIIAAACSFSMKRLRAYACMDFGLPKRCSFRPVRASA